MASLSKRNGKWQARVRRIGHATRAQSFASKSDAQRWIRAVEAELDRALIPGDTQRLDDLTVADLLRSYQTTVTVKKRDSLCEAKRIDVFLTRPWASLTLSKATAQVFARHRDLRLTQVSPGTVIRELGLLRSIFETAMREWDVPFPENPLARLKKPRAPEGRDRRLNESELQALLAPSAIGRSEWLRTSILLAIETGMRRSELLNVRWQNIDFTQSVLTIPVTKNGFARRIPLTARATEILLNERTKGPNKIGRVLPVSANALRLAWVT